MFCNLIATFDIYLIQLLLEDENNFLNKMKIIILLIRQLILKLRELLEFRIQVQHNQVQPIK